MSYLGKVQGNEAKVNAKKTVKISCLKKRTHSHEPEKDNWGAQEFYKITSSTEMVAVSFKVKTKGYLTQQEASSKQRKMFFLKMHS